MIKTNPQKLKNHLYYQYNFHFFCCLGFKSQNRKSEKTKSVKNINNRLFSISAY